MNGLDVKPAYHLHGRTPQYRWWRPLLTFLLLAMLSLVFSAVVIGAAPTGALWDYLAALVSVAVMLPALVLAVRWAERRWIGTLRRDWLWECTRWALLAGALMVGVGVATEGVAAPKDWALYATVVGLSLVLVPIQAAAEEYVFRGWLLQTFASWMRTPIPGAVLSSLLFVGLHEYRDPLVVAELFVFALALCFLTVRTGGLEAAIALHVVNNVVSLAFAAIDGVPSLDQTGDYGLWDVLPSLTITLLYAWWIDRRFTAKARQES